ncbi:PQQ-dependent sugar dehydrogenase [Robertmurraya massiliosenegalensis]|uniref:PQQ-dependent sugar dehydrogenase n=1 Tax=Robertmurraya TaxID=2837507 RepID=UPI0039A477BD
MKKGILLLLVLILASCSGENDHESEEVAVKNTSVEIVAENLQIPWAINQINSTFYISERSGTVMKIEGDTQSRQKVELKKSLATAAEAGLLGFVLAPDFSKTNTAYAYYTYKDDKGQFNRIVTLKLEADVWKEEELLLDQIPSGQYHHGGRLKLGPDDKLYATTGDAATDPEIAQDVQSLGGKILRLNLDGSIPEDNPFGDSYVYSYGHRNPQGLTWTGDGTMYASEHGPSAHDEINLIKAAGNYGWPTIVGDEKQEGVESPLFQSGADMTWAPSGMAFHEGKLYVATLRGNAVREFNLDTGETKEVITGLGRIRDVMIEDGILYFVSNNTDGRGTPEESDDRLYKVELSEI